MADQAVAVELPAVITEAHCAWLAATRIPLQSLHCCHAAPAPASGRDEPHAGPHVAPCFGRLWLTQRPASMAFVSRAGGKLITVKEHAGCVCILGHVESMLASQPAPVSCCARCLTVPAPYSCAVHR